MKYTQHLFDIHRHVLNEYPYAYIECAYTRRTEYMAWICTHHVEENPNRVILAKGQGSTPELAAKDAIDYILKNKTIDISAISIKHDHNEKNVAFLLKDCGSSSAPVKINIATDLPNKPEYKDRKKYVRTKSEFSTNKINRKYAIT